MKEENIKEIKEENISTNEEKKPYIWIEEKKKLEELQKEKEIKKIKEKKVLEQRRLKRKKRKQKKIIKRMIFLIIIIILFLILLFYPYLKVNKINISGNDYFSDVEVTKEILKYEKNEKISLFTFLTLSSKVKENTYFEQVNVQYEFSDEILNVTVDELKPVYHDTKDTYYIDNNGNLVVKDKNFSTPLIVDEKFKEQEIIQIASELAKLKKEILLQIKSITKDKDDEHVIILQMYDGNIVYIQKKDLYKKMKYYTQIQEILTSLNKEPGYIHLDIGDYYEPK